MSDIWNPFGSGAPTPLIPLHRAGAVPDLAGEIAAKVKELEQKEAAENRQKVGASLAADAGMPFVKRVIPLSSTGAVQIPIAGYGIVYRSISNPYGRLIIEANGKVFDFYPGCTQKFQFTGFTVYVDSASDTVGDAELIILKEPGVDFQETPQAGGKLTRTSYSNNYDAANVPAASASVGISLEGVRGVRVIVKDAGGYEIRTGSVRFWIYNAITAEWSRMAANPVDLAGSEPPVGVTITSITLPDMVVAHSNGRFYAEVYGYTNSNGSGPATVYLEAVRQ